MQDYSLMNMFAGDPYGRVFQNNGIMGLDNETLTNLAILEDNIRDQQGNVLTFNMPSVATEDNNFIAPADDDLEAQSSDEIKSEQSGIISLRDIIGDIIDKGVVGLKDVGGRLVASQALGGAGAMLLGPVGALAGGITGLLKGGDLFKRDPVFHDFAQRGNPYGMRTRRAADRISYMLNRGAAGKGFSQTNLDNIMRGFGLQDVDTGSMMDSIAESAKTGYGGFGSSDAAAAAAASGGRDYSSSPGAMAGDMEYGEE